MSTQSSPQELPKPSHTISYFKTPPREATQEVKDVEILSIAAQLGKRDRFKTTIPGRPLAFPIPPQPPESENTPFEPAAKESIFLRFDRALFPLLGNDPRVRVLGLLAGAIAMLATGIGIGLSIATKSRAEADARNRVSQTQRSVQATAVTWALAQGPTVPVAKESVESVPTVKVERSLEAEATHVKLSVKVASSNRHRMPRALRAKKVRYAKARHAKYVRRG